jgi:hypothetical protein
VSIRAPRRKSLAPCYNTPRPHKTPREQARDARIAASEESIDAVVEVRAVIKGDPIALAVIDDQNNITARSSRRVKNAMLRELDDRKVTGRSARREKTFALRNLDYVNVTSRSARRNTKSALLAYRFVLYNLILLVLWLTKVLILLTWILLSKMLGLGMLLLSNTFRMIENKDVADEVVVETGLMGRIRSRLPSDFGLSSIFSWE